MLASALERWGEDPAALKEAFEHHRSALLHDRHSEWVSLNRFYPGVADALQVRRGAAGGASGAGAAQACLTAQSCWPWECGRVAAGLPPWAAICMYAAALPP